MSDERDSVWLDWAQRLHAIAQAGLTYTHDDFDRGRFTQVQSIAAEIMATHLGLPEPEVAAWLAAERGYATPKVDVRAAVFRGRQILLVRERVDGRWSLPGGWADIGESAATVAVREVLEEAGYETRATKLLAALDMARHAHPRQLWYIYKLVFRCELLGGTARSSLETSEVAWFERGDLPPLSEARITPGQVARLSSISRIPAYRRTSIEEGTCDPSA